MLTRVPTNNIGFRAHSPRSDVQAGNIQLKKSHGRKSPPAAYAQANPRSSSSNCSALRLPPICSNVKEISESFFRQGLPLPKAAKVPRGTLFPGRPCRVWLPKRLPDSPALRRIMAHEIPLTDSPHKHVFPLHDCPGVGRPGRSASARGQKAMSWRPRQSEYSPAAGNGPRPSARPR